MRSYIKSYFNFFMVKVYFFAFFLASLENNIYICTVNENK